MYHYESLGDERFQEFCQALLSATFPNAQCLPVGQPDGGRDAYLVRHFFNPRLKSNETDLIVFQVKYIKNPEDSREEREMIEQVIKNEQAKIEKLKQAGLSKYYLITNLKGTAHLNVGSIDKVNNQLSSALGIEAYCWWRDDLDRRLDNNASIKWSYPDILKATDLLEKLVHGQLGEEEERRRGAIRAYITSQYDDDQELKFKQTELRSKITELFVDLPMQPSIGPDTTELVQRQIYWRHVQSGPGTYFAYKETQNSAQYFIKAGHHTKLGRTVLEGAPGQGKSTVTQYICQILRMQLLNKQSELGIYLNTQARIPFRVDLRDLAKWIAGVDPFQPKLVELDDREPRSLEGFLAGQIRYISGGHSFSVSDLTAIARASHFFLALDGFDEVADVTLRQQLVDEITKGTNRLVSAGGFSVQTIVTSRPAAFAKSVRFPREQWEYFELLPLERHQVDEYTTKWMKAKGLKAAEQSELRRVLDIKLKEAHTRYLAKNPMQLTILLSLIHNRGASLPEKRTAMYDAYMDLFFSRESEKSDVVRDNRDVLIDIHRYLAWKLQTAAEAGENGSIEYGELRSTLFAYLDREGEDTTIIDALFNGIIERVGALVSRVQETYEFEVQPLREYFAARYLYETAPYPSTDTSLTSDKFDRLNALVRNPYWLNVARFYGGCFNKGEILTLVNELVEFANKEPYRLTSHPRIVALMLLGDWVFTQYQPAVKRVVAFIGEHPQFRQLLATTEETGASYWSGLPERSGRTDFINILWQRVTESQHADERRAIANAIVQNSSIEERSSRWENTEAKMLHGDWARLGGQLQIYKSSNLDQLKPLAGPLSAELITCLVQARCFEFLEAPRHFEATKDILLNHARIAHIAINRSQPDKLTWLATLCGVYQYGTALTDETGVQLRSITDTRLAERSPREGPSLQDIKSHTNALPSLERNAVDAYLAFIEMQPAILATSIDPWTTLVEAMRSAWGDCAAIDRIAFLGAGVRCKAIGANDGQLQNAPDLVLSARFIRFKSGAPRWWQDRLKLETSPSERRRLLLLLFMWATLKTIVKLASKIEEILSALQSEEWLEFSRDLYFMTPYLKKRRDEVVDIGVSEVMEIRKLSSRTCMFIGQRLSGESRVQLALTIANDERSQAPEIQFSLETLLRETNESSKWKVALPHVRELYSKQASVLVSFRRDTALPENIARKISTEPANFPLPLVALADSQLRSAAGARAEKLLEVARRENWFSERN